MDYVLFIYGLVEVTRYELFVRACSYCFVVAAAVDVCKGQLEKSVVECKDTEAILEGNITVRHFFSTISTQKTPGKSLITADMKENAQSFKRQPGSLIAAKSTKKRRALEEL